MRIHNGLARAFRQKSSFRQLALQARCGWVFPMKADGAANAFRKQRSAA